MNNQDVINQVWVKVQNRLVDNIGHPSWNKAVSLLWNKVEDQVYRQVKYPVRHEIYGNSLNGNR